MDFVGMFATLAEDPQFIAAVQARFGEFCTTHKIPAELQKNHSFTFEQGAKVGAAALAEIVGGTMEKHPYLAKQAMKMLGGEDANNKV